VGAGEAESRAMGNWRGVRMDSHPAKAPGELIQGGEAKIASLLGRGHILATAPDSVEDAAAQASPISAVLSGA